MGSNPSSPASCSKTASYFVSFTARPGSTPGHATRFKLRVSVAVARKNTPVNFLNLMGLNVPRQAILPCKENVEGSIPFGSTKNAKRSRNEELVPSPVKR